MKTLKQAAYEYAISKSFIGKEKIPYNAFIEGAEWSQRWIPIEEYLPNERENVLLLSKYMNQNMYDVGFLFNGKFVTKNGKPTHWRPINYK